MADVAVETKDLSVQFGEFVGLESVSLSIPESSFVAIVGPNGAGKSSFLKVLLGLEPGALREGRCRQTGLVQVFGRAPKDVPPEWIGYVPQFKTFDRSFPALALEVVVSGLRRAWPFRITPKERGLAIQTLERVGAAHLAERRLGRLSGGELQRVYLARSLVRQPKLLLLDEPATGVDPVGEEDLIHDLEAYQKATGATILIITHDWEAALHHASHVLLLNRQVVSFGPPSDALSAESLRRAFGHMGHEHEMRLASSRQE
ncbi:MAG: ABC transporter ATP-binding protein [Deinococcus sp.]|nr:ABC transporter ATP-binding protein [Deinococcus sp.]